jgi:aspartyl-tRNA(Asn)/glutamyl-tRNA(Gln) amidotransferase subunit A
VHHDLPFPAARNPWGDGRSTGLYTGFYTGGSSSGSGAALAAGLASFTLGSDTGGSIRLPAAACGVMGLKPSFGLVGRSGILPNCWSLDVAGPLARTAEDLALILDAIAGPDPGDAGSSAVPAADHGAALSRGVAGLRIGLVQDPGLPIAPAIADNMRRLADHLATQGAEIVPFALPRPIAAYQAASSLINWSESYAIHERDFLDRGGLMGQALRDKMMTGFAVRAVDYLAAQRERRLLAGEMDRAMASVAALLLPCTTITAPPLDDADAVVAFTRHACVAPFNISGHPALSLPTGFDANGLPTAAQLVGQLFAEPALLGIAACCETLRASCHPSLTGSIRP